MNHKKREQSRRRDSCTGCGRLLFYSKVRDAGFGATSQEVYHSGKPCKKWNSQLRAWCVR